MGNQLMERAQIGRFLKIREGLEKLRVEIIKAHANNKGIKTSAILSAHGLPTRTISLLKDLDVVKEEVYSGEGKLLSWVYTRTGENGPVDSQLVNELLDAEKEANRQYLKAKNEIQELAPVVVGKKTPEKTNNGIISWIDKELGKEEQIEGYMKPEYKIMMTRIKETIAILPQLKEMLCKLPI